MSGCTECGATRRRDAENRAWVRAVSTALEPHTAGRYIGEADLAAGADRVRQCFSAAAWDRLSALSRKYDPEGLFFSSSMAGLRG